MSKFRVEMVVPEKIFFDDYVDSIVVETSVGLRGILKGHEDAVIGIVPGIISLKQDEVTLFAVSSEGFISIKDEKTVIFSQTLEWPSELNLKRINKELKDGIDLVKNAKNDVDKRIGEEIIKRANARLKVYNLINKNKNL